MVSDTFSNNQGIMFAVIGGLAGLLLTGGGGIASFLIAGLIALIAAFVGPKLMESFTNPSFDSLDTQGGAVRDQNFKAALLDKNKDGKIDAQEQTKISDPAKLKEILEKADKDEKSGIKKTGDDFTYTQEATLSFLPVQATPPAPVANKANAPARE